MGVNSGLPVDVSAPMRTCIGCRRKAGKADLLRMVGSGTHVVPDPAAVRPGRGAYLHRRMDCLNLAERRRAFQRALRTAAALDLAEVRAAIIAAEKHTDQPYLLREHRMSTR